MSEANESDAVSGPDEAAAGSEPTPAPPLLRVVSGEPTTEELAALVAVVAARRAAAAEAARAEASRDRRRPRWGDPALAVRPTHAPGPGAWRASALPR